MTDNLVVILGEADDIQVQTIQSHVEDSGHECLVLDNESIENDITLAATIHSEPEIYYKDCLLNPRSIYWDNLYWLGFDEDDETAGNCLAYTKLFLEAFKSARWVNPAQAFYDHYLKVNQYRKVNFPTPATIFTNDIETAYQFFEVFGPIAAKPITGGDYTIKITTEEELELLNFDKLFTLQEFIEGQNIRTFVVGDDVFSGAIDTTLVDFRIDKDFTYEPVELSNSQTHAALLIARTLGYEWTAIDWIMRDGELHFLEANFAPRCIFFQEQTQHPITKSIANLLIQ